MKITVNQLRKIIKEEVSRALVEEDKSKAIALVKQALKANPAAAEEIAMMNPAEIDAKLGDLESEAPSSEEVQNEAMGDVVKKGAAVAKRAFGGRMPLALGSSTAIMGAGAAGIADLINQVAGTGGNVTAAGLAAATLTALGFTAAELIQAAKEIEEEEKLASESFNRLIKRYYK